MTPYLMRNSTTAKHFDKIHQKRIKGMDAKGNQGQINENDTDTRHTHTYKGTKLRYF